jgi:hypothetical protein
MSNIFSFQVHDNEVRDGSSYLSNQEDWMSESYSQRKARTPIKGETWFATETQTIGGNSPLFTAMSLAFNSHYPLVLKPDAVWLTILFGLVTHIDKNAEGLRHHFVSHSDKETLTILVDEISPHVKRGGFDEWKKPLGLFTKALEERIGKKKDLIVCDFSTTTDTDRLASQIALMGAVKNYFHYRMMLCCGLNEVRIEGTIQDWESIRNRTLALSEFQLKWWTDELVPVLDQIIEAKKGNPDIEFWKKIYLKEGYGSGSQGKITGWVNVFYPYIAGKNQHTGMAINPNVVWKNAVEGTDDGDFPSTIMTAPVKFIDQNFRSFDFEFYGGLVGVQMADDFSVQPVSAFCIQKLD